MKKIFESALDLIFPPKCEVCKKPGREHLCPECFAEIKFMKPHMGIYSVAVYEGVLRQAIRRFKFNKRKKLAQPLGVLMVQYLSQTPLEMKELDLIIPVPLHKKRHQERGFNQAEHLANVVGKYHEIPVQPVLERVKNTLANFDLPREKRFHNIREAFQVTDQAAVENKRVLLLDDIYTTGATIAECSATLKKAGAKRIEILTLSR
ncbi:MAG: ComF family protein, partial [bacterium]